MSNAITESSFKCRRCGICCHNRGDINLLPMDVFYISKHLGISIQDFINQYTEKTFEGHIFELKLKALENQKRTCIFYGKQGCRVNEVKPIICYLFPFVPKVNNAFSKVEGGCWQKETDETRTIELIIEENSKRYINDKQLFWKVMKIILMIREKQLEPTSKHMKKLYELMYLDYDLSKDVNSQIEKRLSEIEEILIFI